MATLSINDVTVSESAGTATFTVLLTGDSSQPISVDYATEDVTAEAGSDYVYTNGTLNFSGIDGETKIITVPINDDANFEGNETFNVKLSNPVNATIFDGVGLGTITDNDLADISIDDNFAFFQEGQPNTTTFLVKIIGHNSEDVTVNYTIGASGDTATIAADDFGTPTSGTLTFPAGDGTRTQPIDIVINDDSYFEGEESFTVTLSNPSDNATISKATGIGTIIDNADPLDLSIDDIEVNEDAGNATFTITLDNVDPVNGLPVDVEVNYSTADDTAAIDTDYTGTSDTLTFAAGSGALGTGSISQQITVPIVNDTVSEPTETFNVVVKTVSPFINTVKGTGVCTIIDNDVSEDPVIKFGTFCDDNIEGAGGDDILIGLAGNDTISGKGGNDYISGGTGNDILDGGAGNDYIKGGFGNDTIDGGEGNDYIKADFGNDTIIDTDTDFDAIGGTSRIIGGFGEDTFKFANEDGSSSLNLTNATEVSSRLSGVEILDMQDGGVLGDTLTISKDVIDALGDSNKHTHEIVTNTEYDGRVDIYVRGDTVDTVNLDSDWSQASDAITVGADIYDIWTNVADGEEAVIAIQQDVNVNPA